MRGPVVTLVIDGREQRVALGEAVTVGRAGATIALSSPLVSRSHLRLTRRAGVPVVEDLGSHNGTWLDGARIVAPLPVGDGLDLAIGGEIPCSIRAEGGALAVDVGGERILATLGPLVTGGIVVALSPRGEEAVVVPEVEAGVTASLGESPLGTRPSSSRAATWVRVAGDAPVELRVVG